MFIQIMHLGPYCGGHIIYIGLFKENKKISSCIKLHLELQVLVCNILLFALKGANEFQVSSFRVHGSAVAQW